MGINCLIEQAFKSSLLITVCICVELQVDFVSASMLGVLADNNWQGGEFAGTLLSC